MDYIDIFRKKIASEVIKNDGDRDFVNGLFTSIASGVRDMAAFVGLQNVDDITLKNYFETAKKDYLSTNPISTGISHSLVKNRSSWLTPEREKQIEGSWYYSDRYFRYLKNNGRSAKVVDETKRSSLSILKKLADPKSQTEQYVKGLVVGAVQSGKTGNFNAVINRAIDSGYVLVIVLSGIMEDLRSQTQDRIEADVIGEGGGGKKGVGERRRFGVKGDDGYKNIIQVQSITSVDKDFGKDAKALDHSLNAKYVLVCKKNVSVLRNLIFWLHDNLENGKDKHNIPLLILDDEADNASLNNEGAKGEDYASKINGHIRAILDMFQVKTYLGYTATPFANVLQDRNGHSENNWVVKMKLKGDEEKRELGQVDNIFPDDFIELLEPPSNYVGAKNIFSTVFPIENKTDDNEKLPLLARTVGDHVNQFPVRVRKSDSSGIEFYTQQDWENKFGFAGDGEFSTYKEYKAGTRAAKKDDPYPNALPESLKTAIKSYILALGIRESRKQHMLDSKLNQIHNTMLIHVSRFTSWQNKTKAFVEAYVEELIASIKNDNPSDEDSIYTELDRLWYDEYNGYAHIIENINDYLPEGYEDEFLIPIAFDSLKNYLPNAVEGIEIKVVNSSTEGEKLDYPKNTPKKYIAIGGNRLSRGFTLEGLTINYFIRTTNYSDSLLQMGRWFGYRPGYLDCCKIFTTQDSLDKFNSTTECIEELEHEFIKMERQGKTPENFVLRVRKHPGTLKITRPSILKNAEEVSWSYQDSLEMTTQLKITKQDTEGIWQNFKNNIAPKFDTKNVKGSMISYTLSSQDFIETILQNPNNFNDNDAHYMTRFLELANDKGYITDWTVALKITGRSRDLKDLKLDVGFNVERLGTTKVNLAQRSGPKKPDDVNKLVSEGLFRASSAGANIVADNKDMALLLDNSEFKQARENFYRHKSEELLQRKGLSKEKADSKARKANVPERYYREMMKEHQGLLVIYLFDAKWAFQDSLPSNTTEEKELKKRVQNYISKHDINLDIPLVGYAIEFPPLAENIGNSYMQGAYELDTDEEELEYEDSIIPTDASEL